MRRTRARCKAHAPSRSLAIAPAANSQNAWAAKRSAAAAEVRRRHGPDGPTADYRRVLVGRRLLHGLLKADPMFAGALAGDPTPTRPPA
jgi:hypothetical protein